ncbi:hypothetical protein LshimejAT787_0501880 [Lyophyllum shimeji]|uniref:Transmembrane protein n=1 Tax=Lyophyllum shimeji TaxID=47721 RepID=A0A9P3PLW0_LYOSH|nr:hypothetical protein LshimejAT787_0501880 [Lyophyllum shimeji]
MHTEDSRLAHENLHSCWIQMSNYQINDLGVLNESSSGDSLCNARRQSCFLAYIFQRAVPLTRAWSLSRPVSYRMMFSFRSPTLFPPRRSFHRLRSFHLAPISAVQTCPGVFADTSSSTSMAKTPPIIPRSPLRGSVITKLAVIASLVFICTISISFIGANVDEKSFELSLEKTADTAPGIVLLGENVDVDVDEPSITIRWSIIACGKDFILPGSAGIHRTTSCGLPSQPLYIFVDNDVAPTATYDPSQIPFSRNTGNRRSIQNLVQFDSDHVLDVHETRLYPFDTYLLSSTIRAVTFTNETLPIRKLMTIDTTSSFDIQTTDTETYLASANETENASRDIDIRVTRPGSARFFALFLFGLNWLLTHVAIGLVMISRRIRNVRSIVKHLLSAGAIVLAIPQLRNSMPDAPGFDGVLIDSIGYFPQMIISGISAAVILLILISREVDDIRDTTSPVSRSYPIPPPAALDRVRPPPTPTKDATSAQIAHYEIHRLAKHFQGEFVFPPVQTGQSIRPSEHAVAPHRRTKTMPRISDDSETSSSDWVK